MSCPQGGRAGGCLPTETVLWHPQHPSVKEGVPGVPRQVWLRRTGVLQRRSRDVEMLPAPPHLGFGSSGAIPTMSPCLAPLPGPSARNPSSLQGRDPGAGGAWPDTPHKQTFGVFSCSGGSARTSNGPEVGLSPFARSELLLFPFSPSASSSALCHRAWQRRDKPRPPPASQSPGPSACAVACSLAAPFVRGTKPVPKPTQVYRRIGRS